TSDDKYFVPRSRLEARGLLTAGDDTRDPRIRARLRVAGYVPLYEGKSFWLHNPYFVGKGSKDSVSKCVTISDVEQELGAGWRATRMCMRNVASSTNQRTFIVGMSPPAAHGNSAPTLNGLSTNDAIELKGLLASLVVDYVVRMKVSANLNWFFL